jgi:hypothetical protein
MNCICGIAVYVKYSPVSIGTNSETIFVNTPACLACTTTVSSDLSVTGTATDDWLLSGTDMYNANPGNIGIGQSSPQYKLDVSGTGHFTEDLRVQGKIYGGNIGIGIAIANSPLQFATTPAQKKVVLYDGYNDATQFYGFGVNPQTLRYQVDNTGASHVFYAGTATGSDELMRIGGNGNVLIASTTPSTYKLEVGGIISSVGTSRGFSVGSNANDLISNSPAYGLGMSNTTLNQEIGNAVQVSGYYGLTFKTRGTQLTGGADMTIQNGIVKIGIKLPTTVTDYKLSVDGNIACQKVYVTSPNKWADFVFEKNYKLPSLTETESYINENHHLQNIPSTAEVENKGIDVAEMDAKLLQKIEELYLHMIQMQKSNEVQQKEIETLKKQIDEMTKK